ncbi:hypothetical protein [Rhizobium sp. 1399]|uniref:hypothetical protein n=1 Tax=Rhizobium sp. 1399 TaxID=2817758 RepID=UPI00285B2ABF|nr:hypothetical protein [Rhizobium sp. 1399]MDR6670182.1 hypothetical protein [Rhizobium sp. 1399]
MSMLPPMKAERARLKAELEAQEPPTIVIEIKPKAVTKFRERGKPGRRGLHYEINGWLEGITGPDLSSVLLVAEEGFERPTQGLICRFLASVAFYNPVFFQALLLLEKTLSSSPRQNFVAKFLVDQPSVSL